MQEHIVDVRDLHKSFGHQSVINGISMQVQEGSIAALLGPNGASKTTLVRILSTLLRHDSGRATIAGHDVVANPEAVRAITSLTGQYAAVDELLTGEENLKLAARLWRIERREARSRIAELLEQFDLSASARKPVRAYSGGMRRKLDLAMSLISRPRILFLDEPTTGLDPRSRNALWNTVRQLARDGVTVFLTTQYLEEADQLADRITLIDQGRIIAEGTATDLKETIGQSILELWFPDEQATIRATTALEDHDPGHQANELTLRLPTDGSPDEVYRLLDVLHDAAIPVNKMAIHTPTLDDVFLTLTGRHTSHQEVQQ